MAINTNSEFIFVGKDEGGFVENYSYDLGNGKESAGKLFINLSIEQNAFDADRIGEIIFENMRKTFFSNLEVDPYLRFEEGLKDVNMAINEYIDTRANDFIGKLNILIVAVLDNVLFLTQIGEAEAYLIRKRHTTIISEGLDEGVEGELFTNIASGEVEEGDLVILSTTRLLRYISKNDLGRLVYSNFNKTIESVTSHLEKEVLSKIGMILLHAENMKDQNEQNLSPGKMLMHEKEEAFQELDQADLNDQRSIPGRTDPTLIGQQIRTRVGSYFNKFKQGAAKVATGINNKRADISWSKEKLLLSIIALSIVLVFGIWWLQAKGAEDQEELEYGKMLNQVSEQISSAVSTGIYDKSSAAEILAQAEVNAIEVYNSGYHRAKANEYLQQISDTRDQLDGVTRITPEQVADLTQKRPNVEALGLATLNGDLYPFEYNAVYPMIGGSQLQDPLTIDDNEKVISGVEYEDKNSILFFTESNKVIEFLDNRIGFLNTTDGAFKEANTILSFSNNIYLLSPEDNTIWKYTRRRDTFDAPIAYSTGADVTDGVDMAIDGSIYVLSSNGSITRIFRGEKADFPISKAPADEITNANAIYTNLNLNKIYVLEGSENRVLVYTKDSRTGGAVYESQLVFDDIENIEDIYVNETTNTLYLLTKTKVYKTQL